MPGQDERGGSSPDQYDGPVIGETDGLASVVTVDPRDDIAAVCGRVDMTPTFAVVVHARRGNRQLATDLGMRRLLRHAEEGGKVVAIATRSRTLAGRARMNGIPVARKPEQVRWDSAGRRVMRVGPVSVVIPKVGGFFQLAAIFFIVGIFGGLAFTMAPAVTVVATPPSDIVNQAISVNALKDRDAIDFDTLKVPAQEVTASQKVTLAARTTGRLAIDTKPAKVVLSLTNSSRADVTVAAGIVFLGGKDANIAFGLDTRTIVPAGQTVTQGATATALGVNGNVPPLSITKVQDAALAATIKVTNSLAASGGFTEERGIVDARDISNLLALAKDLEKSEQIKQILVKEHPKDAIFLETARVVSVPGVPTPTLGSYAEVLLLDVEVRVSALAIVAKTVDALGAKLLPRNHPDGSYLAGSATAAIVGPAEIEKDTGAISAKLQLSGEFTVLVTEADIRKAVKGRSADDAEAILRELYGIAAPQVDLSPGWAPRLPRFDFRIDVELKRANATATGIPTANDRSSTTPQAAAAASPTPRP